jgi:peroxiredoxin Q/BCP
MAISEGTPAPAFTLPASGGKTVSLSDFAGKTVVLYFYPKDDTPGCTREACAFRDGNDKFAGANAVILGISPDTAGSHDKFVAKYGLNFTLLADVDHAVAEKYGVWVEKSMYGKKSMGIARSTFVIGTDGVIRKVWPKVSVDGHAEEVLAFLTGGPAAAPASSPAPAKPKAGKKAVKKTAPKTAPKAAAAPQPAAKKSANSTVKATVKAPVKKAPAPKATVKKVSLKKAAAKKGRK